MTMLTDVLLFVLPFGLALAAYSYCFDRYAANDDTEYFAQVMREINTGEIAPPARARAAGVA